MSASPIRYATNGGIHLVYRTVGDGPRDLVLVQGAMTNVDGARQLKGLPGEWRLYAVSQS